MTHQLTTHQLPWLIWHWTADEHVCCTDAEINYSLEVYGAGSVCFEHGSAWTVQHCEQMYPVEQWGSGCYQVLQPTYPVEQWGSGCYQVLQPTYPVEQWGSRCYQVLQPTYPVEQWGSGCYQVLQPTYPVEQWGSGCYQVLSAATKHSSQLTELLRGWWFMLWFLDL